MDGIAAERTGTLDQGMARAWLATAALRAAPLAFALLFALLALRGAGGNNVVDTDAARHAMNGAFLYDALRHGQVLHPGAYGRYYYGRLPALSMPYHPPLFPAVEALFYAVFGVQLFAARLAVALAVLASFLLLYRLIAGTHGAATALCAAVAVFSTTHLQFVAADVMLEFPSFVLMLAALYLMRDLKRGYPLWRGLAFAALAGAAVWTKQQTVFLGAVPFAVIVFTRQWRLLLQKTIWISSALFGGQVLLLLKLAASFHGTGVADSVGTAPDEVRWIVFHNLAFYGAALWAEATPLAIGFGALCVAALIVVVRRAWRSGVALYLAWGSSAAAVLLLTGACSSRYLFYVYPAAMATGFILLRQASELRVGEAKAWQIPAIFAGAWLMVGLMFQPEFLRGPAEAAALVVRDAPQRVVYCGSTDGNFIFAVRARDPKLQTVIIPGGKLADSTFQPAALEAFCNRYGIDWLVVEDVPRADGWSRLRPGLPRMFVLQSAIPMRSSRPGWQGSLCVYRVARRASGPGAPLSVPVPRLGGDVDVKF